MLTELCAYLKNYFDYERHIGDIKIHGGVLYCGNEKISMDDGQYFALFRTHQLLGVFKYGTDTLKDKELQGAVWLMDIPQAVTDLADEIEAWNAKYAGVDGVLNSPYQSESYANYSYTKSGGMGYGGSGNKPITWQTQFAARLNPWRKIRHV